MSALVDAAGSIYLGPAPNPPKVAASGSPAATPIYPAAEWSCVIPGTPRTKGNHGRIVRMGRFSKLIPSAVAVKAQADARSVITAYRPAQPFTGAVVVDAVFVFAVAQGKRKGKHKIEFGTPCLKPVDRGNLLKLLEDAMNGLVYLDDKQVVGGDVSKIWGDVDETRVFVRSVAGGA